MISNIISDVIFNCFVQKVEFEHMKAVMNMIHHLLMNKIKRNYQNLVNEEIILL